MKQINSILRTLCLTALLCMTSVNASAYEIFNEVIMSNGIYVAQQGKTINSLNVKKDQVLIILSGVTITVETNFSNSGTIYVFGTLNNNVTNMNENMGTIYLVDKGKIEKKTNKDGVEWWNKPQNKIFSEIATKKKQEVQAPTTTADGVREYWMKGIAQGDDFYPMEYYSDEDCNQKIDNFEEWKKGEGKPDWPKIGDKEYMFDDNLIFPDKAAYQCEYDFTPKALIYSRTFAATGVWQAWFVPFDVKVSDMNAAGMEVAKIAGVLMDGEVPYIAFAKMTDPYAIVNANTPYVVKAKKTDVNMTLVGPDICLRKSTAKELEAQRLTVQSSFDTFTFGGNYQPTKGYANEWYALNTSGTFQKMGDGANLVPQRFWMKIDTRTDTPYYTEESGASAKAFINMTVLGDDETTGIERLTPTLSEGNGVIYNLQGQRVTSIQKGQMYIMNGKKFLAK